MHVNVLIILLIFLAVVSSLHRKKTRTTSGRRPDKVKKNYQYESDKSITDNSDTWSDSSESKMSTTRRFKWTTMKPELYINLPGFYPNFASTSRYKDPLDRYYYNDIPRIGNSKENHRNY
uniref:Uncharacterized protein n=1 Tax=Clastoptera arizonana TaxID=38151 RepID=A0A1B6EF31_9HEMI